MKKALGILIVLWVAIITIAMAGMTVYAEDAPSQEEYTYIVTERDGLSFETQNCSEYIEPMYALEVGEECFDASETRIKQRTKSVPGAFFKASAMASTVSSGRCGDSITYVLDSNGKLTLKGVGATWDFRNDADYFDYHECPWDAKQIKSLEIGEGITVIGADFMACGTNLTNVTFPSTLKSIGSFAFMQCENLSDFTLPAGLESIYQHAFYGCDSLTSVTIPGRVTFLDGQIFANCKNLKSATIDFDPSFDLNTFVYCNNSPYFNSCPNLEKVNVSAEHPFFKSVDGVLFSKANVLLYYPTGKKYTNYIVPEGTNEIAGRAFNNAEYLEKITIANSVTSLGDLCFSNASKLNTIHFGTNLTSIGEEAFQGTGFITFSFPTGVETIGNKCLSRCSELTYISIPATVKSIGHSLCKQSYIVSTIEVSDENPYYVSVDNILYSKDLKTVLICPSGKIGVVSISMGAQNVFGNPFIDCQNVTKFIFPEGMTDTGCFDFCDSLESIVLPASINNLKDDVEQESYFCRCPNLKYIFYLGTETQFQKIPGYETAMQFKLHFNAADHTLVIDKAVDATCKSVGKTAGSHCSICGMVFVAQQTIPMKEHADLDGDGIFECCDNSVNIEEGKDSCICHATGFKAYIYMLIRIIWKLFKINETCVCGVKHY